MNTLTKEQRSKQFAVLWEQIPGTDTSGKLNWLVDNNLCSRQTALTWKMQDSPRPPPENKLRLIERLLPRQKRSKQ